MSGWRFWIDRGGTFTDVVARAPDGRLHLKKLLSENPEHYADAAIEAIGQFLAASGGAPSNDTIEHIKMGTTVATNALLTHSGTPVALVTNAGLEDVLLIGDQTRPDLFALNIRRPAPLAAMTMGIRARVRADGTVEQVPDEAEIRSALAPALAAGIDDVAIVLAHAYRYPEHELAVAGVAREMGFRRVLMSHAVARVQKLVRRGQTTVVDAYLSPILRHYVDQVASAVGDAPLFFMQSHGGLAPATTFRGKDSILSGPAGGLVGAAQTAAAAGFDRIIAFDMGGTSTDVAHFDGQLERVSETTIAGVPLHVPMLDIHTVAAGGGSIVTFDETGYRVGPESAGANPGPACYRRGGPLTVTDCNAVLGRLIPGRFPSVFGHDGAQPLDIGAAHEGFQTLARRVSERTGRPVTPEDVAEGALTVAVEAMARAIRRVSVERGRDLTEYTLCGYGGAAGQHVCRVADALGMRRVFLHPYAGVLSALGMGLAEQRSLDERTVEQPFDASALVELANEPTDTQVHLGLRYVGSDSVLFVPAGSDAGAVEAAFHDAHQDRFGFATRGTPLILARVRRERVQAGEPLEAPTLAPDTGGGPAEVVEAYFGGTSVACPVWERARLGAGAQLLGPAIVAEPTGTTVVEPGWALTVSPRGDAILERAGALRRHAATELDPTLLAVFNHRFMSVAEHMGLSLEQTAHSVNIKERRDYSCALFDGAGRLVANAPHIPVHLGSMGEAVESLIRSGAELLAGDAYLINDPYRGGTHLPDLTVVSPVFIDGARRFFLAARGHHADVGGTTPGSMPPDSTRIDEEGIRFDAFLLARNGTLRETELRARLSEGRWPARKPDQNVADLTAQLAAIRAGDAQLRALTREFGLDAVLAYTGYVREAAAEAVRRLLARLPSGEASCPMDDGCEVRVAVRVDAEQRRATIDFAGTSPQQESNLNAPAAVARAAVLYVFRALTGEAIPLNAGCLEPLDIRIPPGSMLAPTEPAAVVAGNVETSQVICDALLLATGALAGSQGTMNNLTFGDAERQYYETLCGGAGAGPGFAGASAVHTHMTNSRLTDPEVLEDRYPVVVDHFAVRKDSGGAGEYPGGDGVVRTLRFLAEQQISTLANRRKTAPPGLAGGHPGQPGAATFEQAGKTEDLGHRAHRTARPGDRLTITTPGGGGFGPPRGPDTE